MLNTTTGLAETPTRPNHLTASMVADLVGLRRTATEILLASPGAPSPIRPGARPRRWRRTEILTWLRSLQDAPADGLPTGGLISFTDIAAGLELGRTATRGLLSAPGAPSPVRLNARAVRYWADEVAAWDPASPVAVEAAAPVRPTRSVGGRKRKATIR